MAFMLTKAFRGFTKYLNGHIGLTLVLLNVVLTLLLWTFFYLFIYLLVLRTGQVLLLQMDQILDSDLTSAFCFKYHVTISAKTKGRSSKLYLLNVQAYFS